MRLFITKKINDKNDPSVKKSFKIASVVDNTSLYREIDRRKNHFAEHTKFNDVEYVLDCIKQSVILTTKLITPQFIPVH